MNCQKRPHQKRWILYWPDIFSMPFNFKTIKTMGVINITPNSFSDPSKFFLTPDLFITLKTNLNRSGFIFDLGFESTAPMNSSITSQLEFDRFLKFYEFSKDIDFSRGWLSLDTYRVESFRAFEKLSRPSGIDLGIVFNDVSGVIDQALIELLIEKKNDPFFRYVYSFSHIPERELTGKHMSYLKEGNSLEMAITCFKKAEKIFTELGVIDKIIFDPGFGFSKTYEQNWTLIEGLKELFSQFPQDQTWLIGLSKKSFLRQSLPQNQKDLFGEAEKLHASLIQKIQLISKGQIIYRVHDFSIVERALKEI